MDVLRYLRSVYDVDTLDTRFTTPSTVPYQRKSRHNGRVSSTDKVVNSTDEKTAAIIARAEPSKWRTPEFYFYAFIFVTVVPQMFWTAYAVSRPSDPRYSKFEDKLSPGWIPGRKIDVSDAQYHTFRQNLPYMALLLVFHPLLRRVWNACRPVHASSNNSAARLEQRLSFDYLFALFFLVALHGVSAVKVLLILWINYRLGQDVPRRCVPAATWIFNVGTLFANELCGGYRLASVVSWMGSDSSSSLMETTTMLDSYGGIMPRWEILFNLTVLRLISFNMDRYWASGSSSGDNRKNEVLPLTEPETEKGADEKKHEKKKFDSRKRSNNNNTTLSERERVTIPPPLQDFSFRNYVAYAVYAPLYLTGPIVTFNDFVSQSGHRSSTIETDRTVRYAVRFVLCLLAMEGLLHYVYMGAISLSNPDWSSYSAAQLSLLSYFQLHLIWLKLLLPWRFFRLWSLVDGIDPPENMLRCVSNNYSTLSFWRAWHRSYNRWLVRYIWIPLGGADFQHGLARAARSLLTYVLVFTFVALWHDIQLRLLIWGWLVVLFFVPEIAASFVFPARRWSSFPTAYRMLCCAGAVANVLMMMSANLVGFAVGVDGMQSIVHSIVHDWAGRGFLVGACAALFVGVQVMFEVRQTEMRRGIYLKC